MFFFFKYYFLCSHFVLIVLCFLPSTQEFNPRSSTTDELLRDYSSPADKLSSFPPNTCTTIERLGAWRLVQITCTLRLWDSGSATVLNIYSKTLSFRQRTGSLYFWLWNIFFLLCRSRWEPVFLFLSQPRDSASWKFNKWTLFHERGTW